jgi:hypothetical protein
MISDTITKLNENTTLTCTKINIKSARFQMEEIVKLKNNVVFSRFVNWITGEFDLFLQDEDSKGLKVYFPNGCFSIDRFENIDMEFGVAMKVEGKSKVVCQGMMNQLMQIHNHICDLSSNDKTKLI